MDQLREQQPDLYQWVLTRVKPERDQNPRQSLKDRWWVFGEARSTFRPALSGLSRALATSLTAKHRTFVFVDAQAICDSTTVLFALDDAAHFGVLSSAIHVAWALAAGGRLGVGNDPRYSKARCFDPFSFPAATDDQQTHLRTLAEQLGAHRKRQQAAHPELTLTGMYNVLDKLRSGEPLTAKERTVHEHGLVSLLHQLHDEIDAAVLDAYGWSDLLPLLRVAHGNDALLPSPTGRRAGDEGDVRQRLPKAPLPDDVRDFARQLRRNQTDAEALLWQLLRDRRLHGAKFRRQHPQPPYTLDFYCHSLRLAVELDGSQHLDSPRDVERDAALAKAGIEVVRYWNHDLLARTEQVLEDLWGRIEERSQSVCDEARAPSPPTPLPMGEGSRSEAKRAFDEAILERLVALNAERAAEEARGLVRWLRPEFQHPSAQAVPSQGELPDARDDEIVVAGKTTTAKPVPWPKDAVAQVRAVADALSANPAALSVDELAARFSARGPWKKRLPQLLDMLVALGRAHEHEGRYSAR